MEGKKKEAAKERKRRKEGNTKHKNTQRENKKATHWKGEKEFEKHEVRKEISNTPMNTQGGHKKQVNLHILTPKKVPFIH